MPIPDISLENGKHRLKAEDKQKFLCFMKRMLQQRPKDTSNLHDILVHEWLMADLIEEGVVDPPQKALSNI